MFSTPQTLCAYAVTSIQRTHIHIGFRAAPESSDSESDDSSDSGSDAGVSQQPKTQEDVEFDGDDDEEVGPTPTSAADVKTKNEVLDSSIVVPEFTEVDAHETLEEVGEILSIVDGVVIVKGTQSKVADVASERALDTGSLLVFDDRKVLGYVCCFFDTLLIF